jgi:predicted metalloprotease with PDZ domain
MPGRKVQSVAQSSFDSWVKYYRADENTPNSTVSYYTKGALVALALDLTLRSEGTGSLDDVMRALWAAGGTADAKGGPIAEAQIAAALRQVGRRSYARELADWVHGTDDLPLRSLLERAGVDWIEEAATLAQRLGLRVAESALTGVKVSQVLRGGAAERAGLSPGDELLAVAGWRVRRLDDALRVLGTGVDVPLLVARDQRVLSLALTLPAGTGVDGAVTLKPTALPPRAAAALRKAWLAA